jgi:hypothetical protein
MHHTDSRAAKNKYSSNDLSSLQVQYFSLSDGKLSRISGHQPQLCWWSRWPPDLHFGHQKQNLVAQATILVDNIEP